MAGSIQDDGAYASKEFKSFYRQCINAMKREIPDAEFLNVHAGHYDLFGFIHKDGKYIYFSYSVPRGGNPNGYEPIERYARYPDPTGRK